jgi:hypothetical protein
MKKKSKPESTTTKPTSRAYSPDELKEIAQNIQEYLRCSVREYTYQDHNGRVKVSYARMSDMTKERLLQTQREIHEHGIYHKEEPHSVTLHVLGETICKA